MRSLTTTESNYIHNLPLEPHQKARIENVWGKCIEPVIGTDAEVKTNKKNIPPSNKITLIVLLLLQLYQPTEIIIQIASWMFAAIIAISHYLDYLVWKEKITLALLPDSLNRLYMPTPISTYLYYIWEIAIAFLLYQCGYIYLAMVYAIVEIVAGYVTHVMYAKHTKQILNGGYEVDIKIAIIKQFSLKKKNKPEVDVYITVNDKKIL